MAADVDNEVAVDQQVYLAGDIQRMLGIGKSKSYTFLEDVYKQKNPPFKVLKSVSFSECQNEDSMNG